jgi:iron(III) transport system ATP-binding protein
MAEIEVAGLSKCFGAYTAVDSVGFHAESGEMLTLLGPSGCGKTTTLRMIAGLEEPSAGTIRIGPTTLYESQRNINVPSENRGLCMVFQSYAIWPHMTVAENVAFPLKMRGVPKAKRAELVRKVLDVVGLGDVGDKSATKLSGGQQQRVAFARALVFEPPILLLDEPLSNLDAKLREHMRYELREMKRRLGLTALFVTHDQEEALTLSDRLVIMNDGMVEQIGTPEDVYERPATRFVAGFIGKANMLDIVDAQHDAHSARVQLRTFSETISLVMPRSSVRVESARPGARRPVAVQPPPCLFVRPEKIALMMPGCAADGVSVLQGRVRERAYIGDRCEYLIDLHEGTSLRIAAPTGSEFAVGVEVGLGIKPQDMVLYC